MEWQPIETAPRDGTLVLLWDNDCGSCDVGRWSEKNSLWHKNEWWDEEMPFPAKEEDKILYEIVWPTHWMPLPEPPEDMTVTDEATREILLDEAHLLRELWPDALVFGVPDGEELQRLRTAGAAALAAARAGERKKIVDWLRAQSEEASMDIGATVQEGGAVGKADFLRQNLPAELADAIENGE